MKNLSQKELEQLLEKAKRDAQAMMDKMTPEERAQAELKAKKLIEEDQAAMQKIIDDAAKLVSAPSAKEAPKFCGSCGAPASGGKFCEYCGMPL